MANEELLDEFEDREDQTISILLNGSVSKTSVSIEEFISIRLTQGASADAIRTQLIDDLLNNGRLFGEFRNSIRSTASGSLNRTRDSAFFSEVGIEDNYRWSAVLVNSCPDCVGNHGKVDTWEGWEASAFGLPRSGGTICRQYCQCVLLPEESTELEPVLRGKK